MIQVFEQKKFVRATSVTIADEGIVFSHAYGENFFAWESISHVFALRMEKKEGLSLPFFMPIIRKSRNFYYIDGTTTSFTESESDSLQTHQLPHSPEETGKLKEEDLKKSVKELCLHCTKAYFDKPLISYIKENRTVLPVFSKFRDVLEYCRKLIDRIPEADLIGAKSFETGDRLPEIPSLPGEKEQWKEGIELEGQYTIQQILRGSLGTVYIVFDSIEMKFYAMKTFQERHAWDEAIISRFLREAESWMQLGSHPHIVRAELVKEVEGRHCVFLEYVQGTDLEELLCEGNVYITQALEFGIQFCLGMDYASQKLGLVHRDIKPSNCLISREGILKITDFSLGKIFEDAITDSIFKHAPLIKKGGQVSTAARGSTIVTETLTYMAPELFSDGGAFDIRTDVFAFGVMLYEMLTGKNPFFSQDSAEVVSRQLSAEPESPVKYNADIPQSLAEIVLACIRTDRERRYDSFARLGAELEKVYQELTGKSCSHAEIQEVFTEADWISKGKSLASLSCHKEALMLFEQALTLNPHSLDALIYKASSLVELGQLNAAFKCLASAISINKRDWKVWFYCAEAYWKAGNLEEAIACLDSAEKLTDDKALVLGKKGQFLTEAGTYKEALLYYNMALGKNPGSAELWNGKAALFLLMGRYESTLTCIKSALEINPWMEQAWFHQGIALFAMGLTSAAIRALKTALKLNPCYFDAWLYIGNYYSESGDCRNAVHAYQSALQIQPDSHNAQMAAIAPFMEDGKWDDAAALIEKALTGAPNQPDLLFRRAEIFFHQGYFEECRSLCGTVKEYDPSHEHSQLLFETATKLIQQQDEFLEIIRSFSALSPEFCFRDLNTLLSVLCNTEAALLILQNIQDGSRESYYKACLHFIQRDLESCRGHLARARENPEFSAASDRLEALVAAQSETEEDGTASDRIDSPSRKKEVNGSAAAGSPDELLLLGLQKLNQTLYEDSRHYLHRALTQNAQLTSCVFFIGKTYEKEGDRKTALTFYNEFINGFPDSVGYWTETRDIQGTADLREMENIFFRQAGSMPYSFYYWLSFLLHLSEKKFFERAQLIISAILRDYIEQWITSRGSPFFWTLKGLLQLMVERRDDARNSFLRALELDPDSMTALVAMTTILIDGGHLDSAAQYAEKLRSLDRGAVLADYVLADIYWRQGLERQSLFAIEDALQKEPFLLLLLLRKAQLLLNMKRNSQFLLMSNEIHALDSRYQPIKILRAACHMAGQKPNDAISEFEKILSDDPAHVIALRNSGFAYLYIKNISRALVLFEKLLQVNPFNYEGYLGKGMAHYLSGDFAAARESFSGGIGVNPLDPDLWQCLGAANFHLKSYDDSRKCWDRVLYYRSGFIQAWINKGNLLYHGGYFDEALDLAGRALRIDQEHVPAWILRIQCQWRKGDISEAVGSAEKALALSAGNAKVWVLRGILEYHTNDFESSRKSFEKASTLESRSAEIWFNRALLGLRLNNRAEAIKSLDRCLALDPHPFEALLMRFLMVREVQGDAAANVWYERARQEDPEKFSLFIAELEKAQDPPGVFNPLELQGDPFVLPYNRPLTLMEPLETIQLLFLEKYLM